MISNKFTWVDFYIEFASELLKYKSNRRTLLVKINKAFESANIHNDNIKNGLVNLNDVDPFTVFGTFNRELTHENRKIIVEALIKEFGLSARVPIDFDGIPVLNNMKSWFIDNEVNLLGNEIDQLWETFDYAIKYSDEGKQNTELLEKYINLVLNQKGVRWNLTLGLFWIRPQTFVSLDSTLREYCKNYPKSDVFKKIGSLKNVPEGKEYLKYCNELKDYYSQSNDVTSNFELSFRAYVVAQDPYWPNSLEYDPGITKEDWFEYFKDERMFKPITWAVLKAFKQEGYESTATNLSEKYGRTHSYYTMVATTLAIDIVNQKNIPLASKIDDSRYWPALFQGRYIDEKGKKRYSWKIRKELADAIDKVDLSQFDIEAADKSNYWWLVANPEEKSFNSIKVDETIEYRLVNEDGTKIRLYDNFLKARSGDLVVGYEIKPVKKIVALLMVDEVNLDQSVVFRKTEDLVYPIDRTQLEDSISGFKDMQIYKDAGGPLIQLSSYEYDLLLKLIRETGPITINPPKQYSKEDFLNEVFMDEGKYEVLKSLILRKKNVILLGAPGTGKTYVAKRLAFSIIGHKDENRVQMVQFHQNFAYEDFIEGYRPVEGKFELESGIFKNFCLKAGNDLDNEYFFIIDEINRGNISKILGELMMLIKSDKRGQELRLPYSRKEFSVPENVYILGMMNTADRSLAMIDYALRRRFSFFEMEPAFETESFVKYMNQKSNEEYKRLVKTMVDLNKAISDDPALGKGFCVGHSFLCTDEPITLEWLKEVIQYEIIPLLEEYWFDTPGVVSNWKANLFNSLK